MYLIKKNLEAEVKIPYAKVAGRYKLVKSTESGVITYDGDWFDNVITNTGMNAYARGTGPRRSYCQVGTGNTPEQMTDTNLVTYLGTSNLYSSVSTTFTSTPPYYTSNIRSYMFQLGVAAGNLQEVGITLDNIVGNQPLFSRSLIKDANGNPQPITVLPNEILTVYYELRSYHMQGPDTTGSFSMDGNTYDYIVRGRSVQNPGSNSMVDNTYSGYSAGLASTWAYESNAGATINDYPTGTPIRMSYNAGITVPPYVPNSYYITNQFGLDFNQANFPTGINSIVNGYSANDISETGSNERWQIQLVQPIMKNSNMRFGLLFSFSWDRYTI